jgi:hypothetical protein
METSTSHEPPKGALGHYHRIVPFCQITDFPQRCQETIHGEDAVGGEALELCSRCICLGELGCEVCGIAVPLPLTFGLAEAESIGD